MTFCLDDLHTLKQDFSKHNTCPSEHRARCPNSSMTFFSIHSTSCNFTFLDVETRVCAICMQHNMSHTFILVCTHSPLPLLLGFCHATLPALTSGVPRMACSANQIIAPSTIVAEYIVQSNHVFSARVFMGINTHCIWYSKHRCLFRAFAPCHEGFHKLFAHVLHPCYTGI